MSEFFQFPAEKTTRHCTEKWRLFRGFIKGARVFGWQG
jgi:hypothetical protein